MRSPLNSPVLGVLIGTFLVAVPSHGLSRAQIPTVTCTATVTGDNLSATFGAGTATNTWTYYLTYKVDFDCSSGNLSNCYICSYFIRSVSNDGGLTYTQAGTASASSSSQIDMCGNSWEVQFDAISSNLPANGYYMWSFYYNTPGATNDCGDEDTYTLGETLKVQSPPWFCE